MKNKTLKWGREMSKEIKFYMGGRVSVTLITDKYSMNSYQIF